MIISFSGLLLKRELWVEFTFELVNGVKLTVILLCDNAQLCGRLHFDQLKWVL